MMWAFVYPLSHNGVKNFRAGFGHGSSLFSALAPSWFVDFMIYAGFRIFVRV